MPRVSEGGGGGGGVVERLLGTGKQHMEITYEKSLGPAIGKTRNN